MTETIVDPQQEAQAEALFRERYDANVRRTDRLFAYLLLGEWALALAIAIWFSPYGWSGKIRTVHVHVPVAIFLGGAITLPPVLLAFTRPGWTVTRYVIAIAQMLFSGLLIHLSGGRIETHFHIFGSLAFLAFYRDWKVFVPATVIVAADHLIRQALWPESVYGIANPEAWRFLEHAFWVVFEDLFLVVSCLIGVAEMRKIAAQQIAVEKTQGAARELAIAASIQMAILPSEVAVPGLEVSAKMIATDEVGGDYYDVLPVADGCWIAVGDVAGHGFRAGLAMLQAQSALSALVRRSPDARPSELWSDLNYTFYDNVRTRLHNDEHMTMSLLRYHRDGRVEIVGAHEEILVWRSAKKQVEVIPLRGTWVGVSRTAFAEEQTLRLAVGDLLVLYTDGIIEARDPSSGRMLGLDPVRDVVVRDHANSTGEIRDAIFDLTTAGGRDDDASVIVLRYCGVEAAAAAA